MQEMLHEAECWFCFIWRNCR